MKKELPKPKLFYSLALSVCLSRFQLTPLPILLPLNLAARPLPQRHPAGRASRRRKQWWGVAMSFVINGTLQTTECYEGYTKAECEDERDEASGGRDSWLPTECSVDRRCPQYPEENIPQYPYQ